MARLSKADRLHIAKQVVTDHYQGSSKYIDEFRRAKVAAQEVANSLPKANLVVPPGTVTTTGLGTFANTTSNIQSITVSDPYSYDFQKDRPRGWRHYSGVKEGVELTALDWLRGRVNEITAFCPAY